jgi:arsenate reductase
MKKVFHLSTCSTCKRIIKDLGLAQKGFDFQNIKEETITEEHLEHMKQIAGSYEALFSRRSMKFKAWKLNEMELGELDYKKYILEDYSFLKRPVILVDEHIFIGNSKKVVESAGDLMEV